MKLRASWGPARTVIGVTLIVLAAQAQAADRRFMPVPQGGSQTIQVINGMPILSGVGKQFQAATSVAVMSSKQGRLLVSIKNQTAKPMPVEAQSVVATSAGQVLSLRDASEVPAAQPAPVRNCDGLSGELYTKCMTENFSQRAEPRSTSRKAAAAAAPAPKLVQPGEVFATQYLLELPRKQRGQLGAVQVTVEMGGERLSFDFKEVE